MKKAVRFVFLVLFVFGFVVSTVSFVFAQYTIDWMYVQERVYEDGTMRKVMNFGIRDEAGQRVTDFSGFKGLNLYDPNGDLVDYHMPSIWTEDVLGGYYDANAAQWVYGDFEVDSGVSVPVTDELMEGTYRLELITVDDQIIEKTYQVNEFITLPVIPAESFQLSADANGNVHWYWAVPEELGRLSMDYETQARVIIEIRDDGSYIGSLSVRSPSHMGYCFIPSDVVQKILGKGDQFGMRIQLRTPDNNNRSYSDFLTLMK